MNSSICSNPEENLNYEQLRGPLLESVTEHFRVGDPLIFKNATDLYDAIKPEGYSSVSKQMARIVDMRMNWGVAQPELGANLERTRLATERLRDIANSGVKRSLIRRISDTCFK